jgi:flavin reductase (DIM6/NTAB) family NADH-FMN oxidoreductase RutF
VLEEPEWRTILVKVRAKKDFPVGEIRRFLEPGPIVLVSSAWQGQTNIMTMGWHMVMEFQPSLIGCYIWTQNHSFDMVRKSKACVINIPSVDLAAEVVGIGNTSGRDIDKFAKFGLTAVPAAKIEAPMIGECHASFECRLVDTGLIAKYGLFVLEVVKAHAATSPKYPRTLHYRGDGVFMLSGTNTARFRKYFKAQNL